MIVIIFPSSLFSDVFESIYSYICRSGAVVFYAFFCHNENVQGMKLPAKVVTTLNQEFNVSVMKFEFPDSL